MLSHLVLLNCLCVFQEDDCILPAGCTRSPGCFQFYEIKDWASCELSYGNYLETINASDLKFVWTIHTNWEQRKSQMLLSSSLPAGISALNTFMFSRSCFSCNSWDLSTGKPRTSHWLPKSFVDGNMPVLFGKQSCLCTFEDLALLIFYSVICSSPYSAPSFLFQMCFSFYNSIPFLASV